MTTTSPAAPASGAAAPMQRGDFRRGLLNPEYDEQRALLETRRQSLYFAHPYHKRISEYEKVLLYSQPNPDWIPGGYGLGGWTGKFSGGRGAWENYFTEMKSSDWFAFRDPNGRWFTPYVAEKGDEWRETKRFLDTFTTQALYSEMDADWLDVVARQLGAFVHHEYGLFMAHAAAIRDCFTDCLRVALITGSLDHLDLAQMILGEKVYLSQVHEGFSSDVGPSKQAWLEDPRLQGARSVVEEVWANSYDPMETAFAIYMMHDPLFGRLSRREFFYANAPLHGDSFTPWTMWGGIKSGNTNGIWAFDLFQRVLAGDPKFGAHNQKVMIMWTERWLPLVTKAMADFTGMWKITPKVAALGDSAVEGAVTRTVADWARRYAPVSGFPVDEKQMVSDILAAV